MRYFKASEPLIITYMSKEEVKKLWFALNELRIAFEYSEKSENGIWINTFITKTNVIRLLEKFQDIDEILDDDWTKGLSKEHNSARKIIKELKGEE